MRTADEQRGAGTGEEIPPNEEELRAAYEQQIKQLRVEHVLLEDVVTLVNLGMRRTGLAPGTEDERDADQVRIAIESVRALLPLLEQAIPGQAAQIRDAVSQLQLAFVKIGGQQAPPGGPEQASTGPEQASKGPEQASKGPDKPEEPGQPKPDQPGPAQASGRLWVPGR